MASSGHECSDQRKNFHNAKLNSFYNNQVKYDEIPKILDFAEPTSIAHAQSLKASGIPFIIQGHLGWAKFAYADLDMNDCVYHYLAPEK